MSDSCVETAAAPDWLLKLESRREKIKGKLGHESGNGAPCIVCGSECPGLDLHFWRKVCRNCKCRKEQHDCKDDDITGWAQFEILGAIRSKPAYIKISEFTDKPIQLEWVPPNVTVDLASDYMYKLGEKNIPVAGSEAATKRKQQLEYQVPPHDLDATLCHNLTENEAQQLSQYVNKIKENCVGQGNVVRVSNGASAINESRDHSNKLLDNIQMDRVLSKILNSEDVKKALRSTASISGPRTILRLSNMPMQPDFMHSPCLSDKVKYKLKLMKIDSEAIKSAVLNGNAYNNVLQALKDKGVEFKDQCSLLGPIEDFWQEYLSNPKFCKEIDGFVDSLETLDNEGQATSSPVAENQFNSPLPVKNFTKHDQRQQQETPIRKLKFGQNEESQNKFLNGNIYIPSVEKDKLLATILHSDFVQGVLHNPSVQEGSIQIFNTPMLPDFYSSPYISDKNKKKLETMGINTQGIQSAVINGPVYDNILNNLQCKGINYAEDSVLQPIDEFRAEFLNNDNFQQEAIEFVRHSDTTPFETAVSEAIPSARYDYQVPSQNQHLPPSRSDDSGFGSVPPTPNYSTYPGMMETPRNVELNANEGLLMPISGSADKNMYPGVKPDQYNPYNNPFQSITQDFANIQLEPQPENLVVPTHVICKGCDIPIQVGEVAVKAERAGKDATWHPQCFKCNKCQELLADLVYFYHAGEVYCARDLAEILKIPRCSACDELIFTKEYTAAEGATFHIKHFCCYQCDAPLAGQQYVPDEKSNIPLCLSCYDAFFAKSCHRCNENIGPAEQGVAWGNIHWHSVCFLCAGQGCGKSLIGGRFCVKNEMPFCSPQCLKSIIH